MMDGFDNFRFEELKKEVKGLREMVQDHFNQPFTKAHPRNGSWAEVLQYLGLDVEEDMVVVPLPAKDNRAEATAESVV